MIELEYVALTTWGVSVLVVLFLLILNKIRYGVWMGVTEP